KDRSDPHARHLRRYGRRRRRLRSIALRLAGDGRMRCARSTWFAASLLVCLSSRAWGGDASGPRPPDDGETVGTYKDYLSRLAAGPVPGLQTRVAVEVKKEVAEKTSTVSPPEGFADRVNDGLADFLPLFQGAINAVSTSAD